MPSDAVLEYARLPASSPRQAPAVPAAAGFAVITWTLVDWFPYSAELLVFGLSFFSRHGSYELLMVGINAVAVLLATTHTALLLFKRRQCRFTAIAGAVTICSSSLLYILCQVFPMLLKFGASLPLWGTLVQLLFAVTWRAACWIICVCDLRSAELTSPAVGATSDSLAPAYMRFRNLFLLLVVTPFIASPLVRIICLGGPLRELSEVEASVSAAGILALALGAIAVFAARSVCVRRYFALFAGAASLAGAVLV